MRIGASRAEKSDSINMPETRRSLPPKSFAPWIQTSTTLRILGKNNSAAVNEKSAMARCGFHTGHTGNN